MLSLFANPFTMIAGALLISSPIIIHLINRMRYKRVRFAAMEFLLKSQKRSRRKLIIEQMILLLLRILFCLLIGLLLARFTGCQGGDTTGASTFHVILIDDTLSTSDTVRGEDGQVRDVFSEAKRLVTDKIAAAANQAASPQFVRIIRLSEVKEPPSPDGRPGRNFGRLNSISMDDMKTDLSRHKPSLLHVELTDGLKAAKQLFEDDRNMKGVLHVVGDFRAADWGDRNKESYGQAFEELKTLGVDVHLLDAVSPERTPQQKTPLGSDNLAIVDFAPDSRIVSKGKEVEFTVKVRNYSNSEKKGVVIRTWVNGAERLDGTVAIPSVPPNGEAVAKINLGSGFTRGAEDETEEAGTPDRFNLVSAHLEGEVGGIAADNLRYTYVEVRDRVPLLIVDNNPKERGTPQAESYQLQTLFTGPIKGFDVQLKNAADLDNLNLQPYAAVYICDVPRLTDAARKNLEEYARGGGGVAFFMGPSIKSDIIAEYNEKLYRKGEGLFPVPLDKAVGVDVPDDVRLRNKLMRQLSFNKKMHVRKEMRDHPAMEKLYKDNRGQTVKEDEYEKFFMFVVIDRYIKVNQQQLKTGPGGVDTLVYLQNTSPIDVYAQRVLKLTDQLTEVAEKEKVKSYANDPGRGASYADTLEKVRKELRQIAGSTSEVHVLGQALSVLLEDSGSEKDRRPGLVGLWAQSEYAVLKEEIEKLRDEVRFGDPLYVARPFGRGRVVGFLTGAGAAWNDLESYGKAYYPPLMINLQGYLASSGTDVNLALGAPYQFAVDRAAYDSKVVQWRYTEDAKEKKAAFQKLGDPMMAADDARGVYELSVTDVKEPGVYAFKFLEKRADPARPGAELTGRPDYRAIAYNVDALTEGNLARANSDDITQISKAALHTATDDTYDDTLRAKKQDLSESPWLYFVILLVLIFEQAMAVRLSFHTRPVEGGPAAVGQPAMA